MCRGIVGDVFLRELQCSLASYHFHLFSGRSRTSKACCGEWNFGITRFRARAVHCKLPTSSLPAVLSISCITAILVVFYFPAGGLLYRSGRLSFNKRKHRKIPAAGKIRMFPPLCFPVLGVVAEQDELCFAFLSDGLAF